MTARPSWLDEFRALSSLAANSVLPDAKRANLAKRDIPITLPPPFGTFGTFGIWHRDKPAPSTYDPFAAMPPNDPAYLGAWRRWFSLLISHKLEIGNRPTQRPDGSIEASHRTHDEAHALALGEAINLWHERYGRRPDPHSCAGCDWPIGHSNLFALPDGARVHDAPDLRCLIAYGDR
jgi:hypothetical protein